MNKTFDLEQEKAYKDCVTATLPLASSPPPTQELMLSKVVFYKLRDCLREEYLGGRSEDLICLSELAKSNSQQQIKDDATRVLICPTSQSSRIR